MERNIQYWLYFEPYTFIFKEQSKFVVYNSLNYAYIPIAYDNKVSEILLSLSEESSGYCIELSQDDIDDANFQVFFKDINSSYSGNLVRKTGEAKPFIFKPIIRLLDNFDKINGEINNIFIGNGALRYLKEVSIYLNSDCDLSCQNCSLYYRQFNFCTNAACNDQFTIPQLHFILEKLKFSGVSSINILGGNIQKYSYWKELLHLLPAFDFKKKIYIHYKNIESHFDIELDSTSSLAILVDCAELDLSMLTQKMLVLKEYSAEYIFIISSDEDIETLEKFAAENPALTFSFHPLYNKKNLSFFKENVFMDINDIIEGKSGKRDIFRRQVVNENFFGQLTLMPNGEVYSNVNKPKLGNIFDGDSLNKVVYKELTNGHSWFATRNNGACSDCCNRYLCPSPSNYEIALNKPNLCSIKI